MCGITGFNWNDKKLINKITKELSHRGPEYQGSYNNQNISLGHRRLSIIDLSDAGKQPMSTADNNLKIVFNGEIFNYEELKKDLIKKGHSFKSNSDTEVLINGYSEYGKNILNKVNGQFSFAIYDKIKNKLFLARDQLGINPLYYYWDKKNFIFASEIKAIIPALDKLEFDQEQLNNYFIYGYTNSSNSIFKNIYKLAPGSYMEFNLDKNKFKINSYFEFKYKYKNNEPTYEEFLNLFEESVKSRLISDVPIGAFLSGGVDSSAVVAIASKYKKNLNTFSVSFDVDKFDESKYSKEISKKFKTKHRILKFNSKKLRSTIKKLVYHYDEPFGDPSAVPTFILSDFAKKHVTVSLSGDGADELFGGYTTYKNYRLLSVQKIYPRFINKLIHPILFKIVPHSKLYHFFEIGSYPSKLKYARLMSGITRDQCKRYFNIDNKKSLSKYSKSNEFNYLDFAQETDINQYLTNNCLAKVDRASLGNALEVRPPFLDKSIIEFASKLKPSLRVRKDITKFFLKKSLRNILPKHILYRKKQGFAIPLKEYFGSELKDIVKKYTIEYKSHNYVNIKNLKSDFNSLITNNPKLIWRIMMFNLWYDHWIKKKSL